MRYREKFYKCFSTIIVVLLVVVTLFLGCFSVYITRFGQISDVGEADVIIVLGAAVWPDGPSPAMRARVWRARGLYQDGRAPFMIVAGGLGKYPPTEAEAMMALAVSWQVAENEIFLDDQSTNTRENITNAATIMQEMGWDSALLVTDDFHMRRAVALAEELGIKTLRAPVTAERGYYSVLLRVKYTLRECVALVHYTLTK
ncbi:MAG: YdcF family protein [Firmicutes bacterium]|nr:YdcF family protein [Bacillota bacterium]